MILAVEGQRDRCRVVVRDHHVRLAMGDDRSLLLVGDLLLRPPRLALYAPAAVSVHRHTPARRQPRAPVPRPAVPPRQDEDPVHAAERAVWLEGGELRVALLGPGLDGV